KLGPSHPNTLNSKSNLGKLYSDMGQFTKAESLLTEALEGRRKTLGPDHPATLASRGALADMFQAKTDYARAEPLYREVVEILRRKRGKGEQRLENRSGPGGDEPPAAEEVPRGRTAAARVPETAERNPSRRLGDLQRQVHARRH